MAVSEYKGAISIKMEFLNLYQDVREASVCFGIMLRSNDNSAECVSCLLYCNNLIFSCSDVRKFGY